MKSNEKLIQELQVRALIGVDAIKLSTWFRDELSKDGEFSYFRFVTCMRQAFGIPIKTLKEAYDWTGFDPDGKLSDEELSTMLTPYLPGVPQ